MAAQTCVSVDFQQAGRQLVHGFSLSLGTGIGGASVGVQSAFIADADGVAVVAPAVSAGLFDGTGSVCLPIASDVEVIAYPLEPTFDVVTT